MTSLSRRLMLAAAAITLIAVGCSPTEDTAADEPDQQLDITVDGDLERDLQLTEATQEYPYRVEEGSSPADAWHVKPSVPEFTFESEDGTTTVTIRTVKQEGVVEVTPGVIRPLTYVIHLDRALVKPNDDDCDQSFDTPEPLVVTGTLSCTSMTALLPGADPLPHIEQLELSFTYTIATCGPGTGQACD